MADDLALTPDPDAPQTLSEGIPVSDIPQTDFAPIKITGIETVQGPVLEEREAAEKQFATEQMATVGIEPPPEPPPDIDRFLFNEIVPPRADVLPQVHDSPPPSEAEARRQLNKITPLATDEEVAVAQHTVNRFLESQQDDERAKQIEWVQSYYTDENKYKQLAEHPDMKLGIELSPDPELFQQTSVNNAWLNANMGRKLSAPELEIARKHIGKQLFNIPEISNQQFFSKMQEWSKGQAAEKDLADKLDAAVGAHVLSDQLNRTYTPDYQVLEKLKKENPEVVTPENERKFSLLNQRMHGRMRQLGERVLESYSQVYTLIEKTAQEKRDPTPEELSRIVDSLSAIDPEDRKAMWGMVGRAGRAGIIDAKGLAQFTENMSKGWAREFNLSDRIERDRETQIGDMRLQMDAGAKFGTKDGRLVYAPPGQPLTPGSTELTKEGYADYRQKLNQAYNTITLVREAQEAYETIVDPIRPIFKEGLLSTGERGLYALPAMGKFMIGGVVPGFGPILTFDAIQADIYRRTRLENPDMPAADVAYMATISAALQTIPEQIQIGLPLGKFGKLLEVDRDLRRSGFWAGATILGKKAVKGIAVREFMMENFQDAVDMFYPAIQSQFDPNMKRQDVGEVAWQWLSTRPEVFAAVLVPGSVAAGVHTYKDLKNPIRSVFNSDSLRGMGIREDGIERILSKGTFEEMQAQLRTENVTVTPEDRARGHDYISATAATTAARQSAVRTPSYRVVTQKDGSKVFEVLDATGKIVYSNADEDLAQAAYADIVTAFTTERLAAQQAAAASEEGQAATAEAEEALRTLTPESRTSAAHVLEFEDEQQPDAGVAAATARLETAFAADPRSGGKPVKLIVQTRRLGPATLSAQRLNEAITGLERLFGKNVVFVRSGTGEDLPFTGIVNPADPNTIFLDAAGDRNVLALIGHEWAHTLKLSNPTLHAQMVAQMRPLVRDWIGEEAKLRGEEGYAKITDEQLTDELVSNIVGDAFTRPDFLQALHARNPSLFERVVKAIEDFFNSLIEAARGSEWATEDFIGALEALHGVIADTIYEARTAGPEVTTAPAAAPLGFQKGQQVTYPGKRSGVTISATVVSELPNGQIRVEATLPGGGTTIADVDAPDLTLVAPSAELMMATRRGKAAQARAEGISREESVATAFERMHAAPGERLGLLERIKREYGRIRAEHEAAEAAAPVPVQIDPIAEIERLEAQETKALEDLDVEEQNALDKSSQTIADRYADRILAEQDVDARRALERESKHVATAQRKGIEKQFDERRKALASDFRRQQQAVTVQAEQANLAATKEGAAQLSEIRRVHAFAELNALVKALPPEIRGRVGGALTLVQARTTERSLTDFLVKRIAMIDRELERTLRKEYRGRIENLLERTEPRKTAAGVLKSTLGPEAQHSTDLARTAAELDADQTSERLDEIEEALTKPEITPERQTELLEEWAILNLFGDLKNRNAEELSKAHEWLSTLVRTGRSEWRQTQEIRLEDVRAKRGEVITGMGPATREGLNQQEMGQGAKAMLDSFGLSHSSFIQFLARILPRNMTFLKSWQDRVRRADNASQDFARDASTRLTERLRAIANTRGRMSRMMWQLKEVQPKAVKIGNEMVSMSRLEAIQYLLSWNQPDIQQKMRDNDGFTDESAAQMQAMTSDEASQTVMRFLREEYDRIYKAANPVYRRMFGMDMPNNPLYAPARFEGGEVGGDMSPFGGPLATSGITPGPLKARVNHTSKLRQMDAITVYWQHIAQMSHWIHFAEVQRELRGVLTDKEVRRSIQQTHGKMTLQQVEKWIDALGRQGGNKANELLINQWFLDGLISAKAMAALGFNLRTIFAQLDSATRAIFAMPMGRIAKAMLDPRFISNISKAWHSDTIQRRVQGGASPEARYLFEQTRVKPSLMLRLGRASMAPVQFTDGVLTSLSSAIVYTDSYNQNKAAGMTDEQAAAAAADDMDDAVYRYSQPTGLGSRSLQELTGDRWKKAFMMFMSDPRLKAALYAEAAKNIMSGKGTKADARRILAVHAMALLSQIVINAYKDTFSDDDDEDIWTWQSLVQAFLMGPIQGFIVVGSAGELVMSKLLQGRYFAPSRDPLLDVIGRGERAMTHWEDAFQTEDKKALIREWDNIFRAIAVHPVTAGPATIINFMKPIFGLYENIQKEED